MSIETIARATRALTPEDELIGSMTRERVSLLLRYAAGHKFLEDGYAPARHWLAHMLDTEVPETVFDQLCGAFTTANMLEDLDLELWYDIENTESNRAAMQDKADYSLEYCIRQMSAILCNQMGVTA